MVKSFVFGDYTSEFCANSYIVGDEDKPCVVIDFGTTSSKIINYIKTHYKEVKAIILTHGHFDHIRGIDKLIAELGDIPVFISKYDAELLKSPKLNGSKTFKDDVIINAKVNLIENDQILDFGNNLKFLVKETPYHTDGSVCLINEEENALFTGDSLFIESIGRYDLPTSNRSLIKSSLEVIKNLDKDLMVYSGHDLISEKLEIILKNNIYLK